MPEQISTEAAVVGSTSWGVADENSDLDLDLWVNECQFAADVKTWLVAEYPQASFIESNPSDEGECIRAAVRIDSIWVEMVWRTFRYQDQLVQSIASGQETSRGVLINAWNIHHALPIKTEGRLGRWKEALSEYPQELTAKIVVSTASFWQLPHRLEMLWVLAKRVNLLSLNEWIAADVEDSLRILFAINHVWEPDWKNLSSALQKLEKKPLELEQRINQIYSTMETNLRIRQSLMLVLDVLDLVPSNYDVGLAKLNVRKSLQKNPFS